MKIRHLSKDDNLYAVSRIYEESWKSAYRDILPKEYLKNLPAGHWVPYLKNAGKNSLILMEGQQIIGTSSYSASRSTDFENWERLSRSTSCLNIPEKDMANHFSKPQWMNYNTWDSMIYSCGYLRKISAPDNFIKKWDFNRAVAIWTTILVEKCCVRYNTAITFNTLLFPCKTTDRGPNTLRIRSSVLSFT